jgi:hypothetical protein
MANKKLLLILGAGASFPYGFPTSNQLRELILGTDLGDDYLADILKLGPDRMSAILGDRLNAPQDLINHLRDWKVGIEQGVTSPHKGRQLSHQFLDLILTSKPFEFPPDQIHAFRATFKNSDRVSIDSFINQYEDTYGDIAKAAVAAFILLFEREGRLGGDWYQVLNEALLRNFRNFAKGDLRIITFNYDRSLERYLHRTFQTHFRKNEVAKEALLRIETHYVYGSLGSLDPAAEDHVDYGRGCLKTAANGIHLATDRSTAQTELISEWLAAADRVIFLGFGFWEENVKLLPLQEVTEFKNDKHQRQERFSSAYRLPKYIVADMKAQHRVVFGEINDTGLDYVTNTAVFSWKVSLPPANAEPTGPIDPTPNFSTDW